ncbi:MAG: sulfur oxidation c-type cytochrome SoxX [Geminicoccaceae bacterium]
MVIGHAAAEVGPTEVTIVDETSIPEPLTDTPGNPEAGRDWVIDRRLGNCLSCHAITALADEPYHGETGPTLDGVADRYNEAELRLQVVNSKVLNPNSLMPGFYRVEGLNQVKEEFEGKPILTAQQVEDVVAYLLTLKEEG